jgi:hypothetical protein
MANRMRRSLSLQHAPAIIFSLLCLSSPPVAAQADDPKQAICQTSWERCLGSGGGKNWKPVYDRCVKARSVCLGGRAYLPKSPPTSSSAIALQPMEGSGNDFANADPSTAAALCESGDARGTRNGCVLAPAGEGYGQNFSLLGPAVPLSRIQRASSVVKCAGGKAAMFYANGRIDPAPWMPAAAWQRR